MNSQTAWYFYYLCIEVTEEFPVGAVSPSIRPLSTSEAPAEALSPTSGMDATFFVFISKTGIPSGVPFIFYFNQESFQMWECLNSSSA